MTQQHEWYAVRARHVDDPHWQWLEDDRAPALYHHPQPAEYQANLLRSATIEAEVVTVRLVRAYSREGV